ncbi:MAG: type 3 dihydrofolate reductase [Kangiellaceae bacterium]
MSNIKQKPIISLVAAMAKNRVIGKDNKMPWHLPADLQHFKHVTMSKPIVMGRKTFESIGRPLPGRENVIISKNRDYFADGCIVVHSVEDALKLLIDYQEIMIIGGGFLYSQTIKQADKLYLTFIDLEIEGDTCFPEYETLNLSEIKREKYVKDEKNPYDYEFVDYEVNQ